MTEQTRKANVVSVMKCSPEAPTRRLFFFVLSFGELNLLVEDGFCFQT